MGANNQERRPLLTSRQVAMVGALGGLGFAWRALGLTIPLYPPYVLDIREAVIAIVTFAGGPYVGIATGILIGLPSAIPFWDMLWYGGFAVIMSLFTKTIYASSGVKRYLLLVFAVIVTLYGYALPLSAFLMEVLGFSPWKPYLITSYFGGPGYIYGAIYILSIGLALKLAPDFMRPRWTWRGGELPASDQ